MEAWKVAFARLTSGGKWGRGDQSESFGTANTSGRNALVAGAVISRLAHNLGSRLLHTALHLLSNRQTQLRRFAT